MLNTRLIPSYGRCKNRKLSASLNKTYEELLAIYSIDVNTFENFFSTNRNKYQNLCLEIGFGSGEHLMSLIENDFEKNNSESHSSLYIGSEVFINGIASFLSMIKAKNGAIAPKRIDNLAIWNHDVRILLSIMPKNTITEVYILFPDPWPKNKQKKRRIINQEFINRIYEITKDDGIITIATDCPDYSEQINAVLNTCNHPSDAKIQITAKILKNKDEVIDEGIYTKYARKALTAGSMIFLYKAVAKLS